MSEGSDGEKKRPRECWRCAPCVVVWWRGALIDSVEQTGSTTMRVDTSYGQGMYRFALLV